MVTYSNEIKLHNGQQTPNQATVFGKDFNYLSIMLCHKNAPWPNRMWDNRLWLERY